jgi:hypothetical protein
MALQNKIGKNCMTSQMGLHKTVHKAKSQESNPWLRQKRLRLVGNDWFSPKDYGHLLWHWGMLGDPCRLFLKKYARLRGMVLASQGRVVTWTRGHHLYPRQGQRLTEEESLEIERQWRQLVQTIPLNDMAFLDWLTQDPIDYNLSKEDIIRRFRRQFPSLTQCLKNNIEGGT